VARESQRCDRKGERDDGKAYLGGHTLHITSIRRARAGCEGPPTRFSWANDSRLRPRLLVRVLWFGLTCAPNVRNGTIARVAAAQETSIALVRRSRLPLAALCVNLAVTLPLAFILNIWQDEAYTLQTTSRDLGYAFHQAIAFEQNAPLYFLLETVWRHVNGSIFFLRLPSVLCVAATIALVPWLARRYVPRVDAGLVTLLVACNPFVIWAAVEMRVYALVILLSALLLLAFYDAFLAERPAKMAAVAYAACVIVALYTQYYLGFLVAAQGLTLLIYRPRALLRFALCGVVAAIAFAPMLAIVPSEVQNFKSAFTPPSPLRALVVLAGILARYELPLLFAHAKMVYFALAVGLVLALIVVRGKLTAMGDGLILAMTGGAFAFFAIGTYLGGVHVLDRHAASLFLPCTLSVFAAFTFLRPPLQRGVTLGWFWLAIIASSAAVVQTYLPLAKPGDWIRATAYLRANERPGEPILVFEAENALPFSYYYNGPNRVIAIPHGVDFNHYDVTRFVIHTPAELDGIMPHAPRLWLITAGECTSANVAFGCGPLESFVARHYRVESSASFYGSQIRLLSRD
jgi:Dolichyl-phosphate-mannose-protein mannosyltransferase